MKRIILATALVLCAATPFAQMPEVPKHKCEPKPEYPGRLVLQSDMRRKLFERDIKNYKECIDTYLAERKAAMKANEEGANAAINEYNELTKKLNADQAAANK